MDNLISFENAHWVGSRLGYYGKAALCFLYPYEYAEHLLYKLPEYAAYNLPKLAMEGATGVAFWGSRKIYNMSSYLTGWAPAEDPSGLYSAIADQANQLSLQSTSWATGKNITQVIREQENGIASGETVFKAADLIGPALLLSLSTNKALSYFSDAAHHAKLLITNARFISTAYEAPALNSKSKAIVEKTRQYTAAKLFKDTLMESALTGLWGGAAYFTYNGIYSALLEASGNNQAHALLIARVILTASVVGPTLYEWVSDAVNAPTDISRKQSEIAPHLIYTDFDDGNSGLDENDDNNNNNSKKLSHADKMRLLAHFRGKLPEELEKLNKADG